MTDVIDHLYCKAAKAELQEAADVWSHRYAMLKELGVHSLPSTLSDQWTFGSAPEAVDGLLEIICRMAADIADLQKERQ